MRFKGWTEREAANFKVKPGDITVGDCKPNIKRRKKIEKVDLFPGHIKTVLKQRCVKEYYFHPVRKWRFDYALPELKIAIEVEGGVWSGGRHITGTGFLGDCDKYNSAAVMGWIVIRVQPIALFNHYTLSFILQAIEYRKQLTESVNQNQKP
jgi:hypothetical protein